MKAYNCIFAEKYKKICLQIILNAPLFWNSVKSDLQKFGNNSFMQTDQSLHTVLTDLPGFQDRLFR